MTTETTETAKFVKANSADAALAAHPWARVVHPVFGGFMVFDSTYSFENWNKRQEDVGLDRF